MGRRKGSIVQVGDSLRLQFYYKGQRFRPTLKGLSAKKKTHWKTAEDKLTQIQAEIISGDFNFARHFPEHPKARQFLKGSDITIEAKLSEWIEAKRRSLSPSTLRSYRSSINHHLNPTFGATYLPDLTIQMVKTWIQTLQIELTNKTINNHMVPLREIYKEAFEEELIDKNPLERIRHPVIEKPEVEPFQPEEMWRIINASEGQIKNLIQFAFWTGLRTGEYIALKWDDVDIEKREAYIRHTRNRTGNKSSPKTKGSVRKLQLTPPATEALREQRKFTSEGHVFRDPRTDKPWKHDSPVRELAWKPALKAADVSYRKPYATRHTFASMMLSSGMAPMWVVHQMGHTNLSQLISTYGKYIPSPANELDDRIRHLWAQSGPES